MMALRNVVATAHNRVKAALVWR